MVERGLTIAQEIELQLELQSVFKW